MNKYFLFAFFLIFILFSVQVYSEKIDANAYNDENNNVFVPSNESISALQKINSAKSTINKMKSVELNTQRLNDLLLVAETYYSAEIEREKKGESTDYSLVTEKIIELNKIANTAFLVKDELEVFRQSIEKISSGIDKSPVEAIYRDAKKELDNQRYENVTAKIDKGYTKIIELESIQQRTAALFDSTKNKLTGFISVYKYHLTAAILIPLLIYFVFRGQIKRHKLKGKISEWEMEKKTIENLVKDSQKQYFEKGAISETLYKTRIKVFGELIRDINRKVSVAVEEIEKTKLKGEKSDRTF